ncbi:MAG TPA: TonB-dependent receptor [Gemmatimonadaceae bacterium]|nr:TonB-dependent receptor [Gemmatimonadaceae bacterium]
MKTRYLMSPNRIRILFVLAVMAFSVPAWAQTGTIAGKVTVGGKTAVAGSVKAASGLRSYGAPIDQNGNYRITGLPDGTYTVTARSPGYAPRIMENVVVGTGVTTTTNFSLVVAPTSLTEVITTASRAPEKVIDAPASVSVVTAQQVNERASINVADHVAALPGIDVARGGLMRANIVSRGFNNIFSGALMTLTDNRFAFVPSLRVNIPYLSTTTNDDIERIEVVLGPGAALYGPNTASGVMALFTKSPFAYPGTTLTVDGGNQDVLRGAVRTAWVLSPKFAIKGAFEAFRGTEWDFCDGSASSVNDKDGPCYQIPADTIGELSRRDRNLRRMGGEVRMDYRPSARSEFIANYGRSKAGLAVEPTGLGPAQVKDWVYQTYQVRGRFDRLFGQVFMNTSDAGGTYLLGIPQDANKACPDSPNRKVACIIDQSRQVAAQVQHGLDFGMRQRFLYGLDYIHTEPRTDSTINGRNEADDVINEIGGYLHSVTSLSPMFELTTAARVDKHSRLEDPVFSPRVALVFKPVQDQNFRLTFNRAFSTPSTNNLFLDRPISNNGLVAVRALGTPDGGLQYRRDCPTGLATTSGTGFCMKVFPAFGGNNTYVGNPYANSFGVARSGIIAALTPSFGAQGATLIANFLAARQPTAAQVGTTLIIPAVGGSAAFAMSPSELFDIDAPKPTTHTVLEAGYKGIIGNRLQLSVDLWHENRKNFVGPLQIETPLVYLNNTALNAYLKAQLEAFLPTIGAPAAAAGPVATQLAGALPGNNPAGACNPAAGAFSGCPLGVLNFDTPNAGTDVVVAYRSYSKPINLVGSDIGAELLLDRGFSVQGTYSWVNKKLFSKADLGTRDDVSLNAPAMKHTFAINYRGVDNGFGAELRERHVDTFNTLAFVGGIVKGYTLLDAGVSFKPNFLNGALIAVNGTNILDKKHREFTQGNLVGRLIITRLQMSF